MFCRRKEQNIFHPISTAATQGSIDDPSILMPLSPAGPPAGFVYTDKSCPPSPSCTGPASASLYCRSHLCVLAPPRSALLRGGVSNCPAGAPWAPPRPGYPTSPPPPPVAARPGSPMSRRRPGPLWPSKTTVRAARFVYSERSLRWDFRGEIRAPVDLCVSIGRSAREKILVYLQLWFGLFVIGCTINLFRR